MSLHPGCWAIHEFYGDVVIIMIENDNVIFRYEAIKNVDKSTIWVLNMSRIKDLKFKSDSDSLSVSILSMRGPYG